MREVIISELGKLVGLELQDVGRASNLFWLGFGDIIQITRRGKAQESAEFSLHIQCSWRITLNNKIFEASRDFYSPSSEWDEDIDDWDIKGSTDLMNEFQLL